MKLKDLLTKEAFNKVRDFIMDKFKKWIVGLLFKKILGGMVGGIKGFLLKYVINIAWKKWIKPGSLWLFRIIHTAIKKPFYKKKAKAVEDAKTSDDWSDAIDDLP